MAHLTDPSGDRALHLVVTTGLPRTFTQAWDNIKRDEPGAPARAACGGAFAWSSPKSAAYPAPGSEPRSRLRPSAAGMAAVPLPGPDGPLGTLSVLTSAPCEPSPDQQIFLQAAARWAADHLRGASQPPSAAARGVSPALSGTQLQQALNTVMVGTWEWDIRTGDLTWSDALCAIFGVHPDTFDGSDRDLDQDGLPRGPAVGAGRAGRGHPLQEHVQCRAPHLPHRREDPLGAGSEPIGARRERRADLLDRHAVGHHGSPSRPRLCRPGPLAHERRLHRHERRRKDHLPQPGSRTAHRLLAEAAWARPVGTSHSHDARSGEPLPAGPPTKGCRPNSTSSGPPTIAVTTCGWFRCPRA